MSKVHLKVHVFSVFREAPVDTFGVVFSIVHFVKGEFGSNAKVFTLSIDYEPEHQREEDDEALDNIGKNSHRGHIEGFNQSSQRRECDDKPHVEHEFCPSSLSLSDLSDVIQDLLVSLTGNFVVDCFGLEVGKVDTANNSGPGEEIHGEVAEVVVITVRLRLGGGNQASEHSSGW